MVKAKAKPVTKPKSAVKKKGNKSPPPPVHEKVLVAAAMETDESTEEEEAAPANRRRLERWDSEGRALRAVQKKLWPIYGQARVQAAVNKKGESIKDKTLIKVRVLKASGKRKKNIPTKFWREIVDEFSLSFSLGDGLDDPADEEPCDEEIAEALNCSSRQSRHAET